MQLSQKIPSIIYIRQNFYYLSLTFTFMYIDIYFGNNKFLI